MENKINIYKKLYKFLIFTLIISILYNLNNINNENVIRANNEQINQLFIDSPEEVYENTNFYVSVYTIINSSPYYQIDAIIIFDNNSYNITNNNPEIIIKSPNVKEDTNFSIKAIKNGYLNTEKYIKILNNNINKSNLVITILDNDNIIEGNTFFNILITDQKGIPINNVTVGIQNFISTNLVDITDENGKARLYAPNEFDEIIILAQKNGYLNDTEKIWIKRNPLIFEKIIHSPYTLIIISIFILITSIIIVNSRKKNIIFNKKLRKNKKYKNKSSLEKSDLKNNIKKNTNSIKEAKIEEIRIDKKENNKKIINLKNKDYDQKKINIKKKDQWFEGIDDIRYKIDKMTNNKEVINENKWFEGKENLRDKIDKTLKKNIK
jgi:hypothetical protein